MIEKKSKKIIFYSYKSYLSNNTKPGSVKSAKSIMKEYEIFYNFIRKHQAINCCLCELATDLILESQNKWLELIKLSKVLES